MTKTELELLRRQQEIVKLIVFFIFSDDDNNNNEHILGSISKKGKWISRVLSKELGG